MSDKNDFNNKPDPTAVAMRCPNCQNNWAKALVIPSEQGIRQYTCMKCRYAWTIKVGGPVFNF